MANHPAEEWANELAAAKLEGRTIVRARYMTEDEAKELGWYSRPVVLFFDDGSQAFLSTDDEGNDGGALFGHDGTADWTLGVLR